MSRRPASLRPVSLSVAVLCTASALVAACGGSAALAAAQARQDYLNDVAPVRTAGTVFATDVTTWSLSTTRAETEADAAPLITAEENFDQALSSTAWPANAAAAVQTLITENKVIIADLNDLDTVTYATVAGWEIKLSQDTVVDGADSNLVRSDLALPQATLAF